MSLEVFWRCGPCTWIASKKSNDCHDILWLPKKNYREFCWFFPSLVFSKNPVPTSFKKWNAADHLSLCNRHTMYFALLVNRKHVCRMIEMKTKSVQDRVRRLFARPNFFETTSKTLWYCYHWGQEVQDLLLTIENMQLLLSGTGSKEEKSQLMNKRNLFGKLL